MDMETVLIPGVPPFGRSHAISPSNVELPLEVRTNASLQLLYGLFTLSAGVVSFIVVALMLWMLVLHPSEWILWIVMVGLLPAGLVAISAPATAWICIRDALRTDPVMILRADGIEDRRAGTTIPWVTVSRARIFYCRGQLNQIRLTLRTPIHAPYNPFRFGTMGYPWRRRPNTARIPVVLLDVKPYTLAQVILVLVKRHGGEITVVGGPRLLT
ncbi:hypothetical protein [Methylobacterium tarhaniae]|nr:hypothetical protein [Methylobacterium tarhaniae]